MKQSLVLAFLFCTVVTFAQIPPPRITVQPVGSSVCVGLNTTISVTATGSSLTYQWYRVNTSGCEFCDFQLADSPTYTGTRTRTLTINTTGGFGAGDYYVLIQNAGGYVYSNAVTVSLLPTPGAPATSGGSACNPGRATLSAFNGSNGEYRWYTVSSGGSPISGEVNSNYTTPILTTTTTYYVSINNGRCEGPRTAVTATVINPPAAPGATGASSCGPGSVTLTATGGTPRFYRWYTAAGVSISGEQNPTYVTPVLSTTTNYYVAITNGCESPRTLVTATINTVPGAPTVTDGSGCGPSNVSLTATGASNGQYRWYTAAGIPISGQTNGTYVTPTITTTTTYVVAINIGGCQGPTRNITAFINTPPNPPTGFGNSACGPSAAITLSATGGRGTGDYRWYTAAGVLIAGEVSSTYTTPIISTTTNYSVAINNGTCESTRTTVTATINTPPTAPTTTGNSACGTSALTLSASGGTNGQYRWYSAAGVLISGQTNSTYTTPSLSVTTNYLVSINNGTCESSRTSVTATINTPPTGPATTGNSACGTSSVILNASGGTNGQYRWYTAAGVLISGETNSTYTTPSLSTTTSYSVAINNGTCESTRTSVTATINTIPGAPVATGNSACGPSAITLSATGGSAGQYRWYTAASVLISGQTSNSYTTPVLSTTTSYLVSINNGTCESSKVSVTAAINTIPTPPTTTGNSACGTSAVVLSASGGVAGQYRWYDPSNVLISGQTNSTYTTPSISSTTTYSVAINNGTCESSKTSVTATILSLPTAPTTTGNSACGPNATITLSASGGGGGQYRWYTSVGGLIAGETSSNYTTPSISTTTTYSVAINNGTCESTKTPVTATVIVPPNPPTVPGNSGCGTTSVTLTASGGSSGQYRWYTVSGGGSPISGETNNVFVTPVIASSTTYYASINNGVCESTRTPVTATINTPPSSPTAINGSSCSAGAVTIGASGGSAGQFRWYTVATGGSPIPGEVNGNYTTPFISASTLYYASINNGTCESSRTSVLAQINSPSSSPTTTSGSSCGPGPVTVSASGGSSGQYRWYTQPTGGSPISGQTNNIYTTPVISTTTTYYVAINNGTCESGRSSVIAQINTIPAPPLASAVSGCAGSPIAISATGGSAGQYRWYTTLTGGTAAAGQTNSTYTPVVEVTTTFYVSVNNGVCESTRTSVVVTANICNQAPVIQPEDTKAAPGGTVSIDLLSLISDPDNNLDLSTLKVIVQPLSGASARIDGNSKLTLDYKGINFRGTDKFTVQVCDLLRSCAQKEFTVEVEGDLIIYNGISPNGDGKNDLWIIQGIEVLEDTKANHVSIFNRWGDSIFEADNYDNGARVFGGKNNSGQDVPAGTYFYKIEYRSGRKTDNGYFTLKR